MNFEHHFLARIVDAFINVSFLADSDAATQTADQTACHVSALQTQAGSTEEESETDSATDMLSQARSSCE